MTTCATTGCERAVMASSGGNKYRHCEAHVRALLAHAFAPEPRVPEWVRRMQESRGVGKDYTRS